MKKIPVEFSHNGFTIKAKLKPLTAPDLADIEGLVSDEARRSGNYRPRVARFVALYKCVDRERIQVDNVIYSIKPSDEKALPLEINGISLIDDYERDPLERLVGYVIYYNRSLLQKSDLREAFEEYALDDDEIPSVDPIPFPDVTSG